VECCQSIATEPDYLSAGNVVHHTLKLFDIVDMQLVFISFEQTDAYQFRDLSDDRITYTLATSWNQAPSVDPLRHAKKQVGTA
jgi:hypothetical protein